MALVNITKAAELAGISRTYFYKKYINTNKINVSYDLQGNKQIDTSEILRVFGTLHGDVNPTVISEHQITQEKHIENNEFHVEVQLLRQQVEHQKELLEEKDKRLDDYAQMFKLLSDKSPALVKKSFIHSLFSRKER